jgi:DNA modification methylase
LRDYGTAEWEGGDENCDHRKPGGGEGAKSAKQNTNSGSQSIGYSRVCGKCGAVRSDEQIGSEENVDQFVGEMVAVFDEVYRVLRDDGTLWLNLGDTYNQNAGKGFDTNNAGEGNRKAQAAGRRFPSSLPSGNLVGVPWRVAFALQEAGWILRGDIIWHKPNPMPESCKNRCTKSHEYIFLFSKQQRYFYDDFAIQEKSIDKESIEGRRPRS